MSENAKQKKFVYCLTQTQADTEYDHQTIGVFSNWEAANKARENLNRMYGIFDKDGEPKIGGCIDNFLHYYEIDSMELLDTVPDYWEFTEEEMAEAERENNPNNDWDTNEDDDEPN